MKIVLVYPNLTRLERVTLGIGCISSYLKTRGHECFLVDYTWGGNIEDTLKRVQETGAKIVGFSVKSGEVDFCSAIAQKLKKEFNPTILFGGVHPSVASEDTIALDAVDVICKGEGEEPTAELLDSMQKGVIDISIPILRSLIRPTSSNGFNVR